MQPRTSRSLEQRVIVIFLVVTAVLAGCSRPSVVTIVNRSSVTLSNVVISGTGFSEHVGNLGVGAKHRLAVHPTGESGLGVAFDAAGKHFDAGRRDYFEDGGYRITAIVQTNFTVSVSVNARGY